MRKADRAFDRQNKFSGLRPVDEADIDLAALEGYMADYAAAEQVRPVAEVAWEYARKAGA